APQQRWAATSVGTGSQMIGWGGEDSGTRLNSGSRYDPVEDSWSATKLDGTTPAARRGHSAVWTGYEMVIFGGRNAVNGQSLVRGGRYNPVSDTWLPTKESGLGVNPTARQDHVGVWTGKELIIWGGSVTTTSTTYSNTGFMYNPAN